MVAGKKVGLRPVQYADLPTLEGWTNDSVHNSQYNTFSFQPANRLKLQFDQDGMLDSRGGTLIVVELETAAVIGSVSYHGVAYGPNEGSQAYNNRHHAHP